MTFKNLSINRKLMFMGMLASVLALLLTSVGFLSYDLTAFRTRMRDDLMGHAEIIGWNSMAALALRNKKATGEILSALHAKDEIVAAAIYTPDGRLFTFYRRDPSHVV